MPPIELATSDAPRVSIVVLGWREAPYLLSCLEAVGRQCTGTIPYELLLFLNEPSPALVESVEQQVQGARIAASAVNLGFAGGNNAAAAQARGEFILLLNDDAEVEPGWLEALVEAADSHPTAGAIGSRVLAWDGTIQEAGGQVWRDGSVTPLGYGLPGDSAEFAELRTVDFASGCSLLLRRMLWKELGGFDERYFPGYYEDVDLCLRIHARGFDVLCAGRSAVRHRHSGSSPPRFKSFLLARNAALLRALRPAELEGRPMTPEGVWAVREREVPPEAAEVPGQDEPLVLDPAAQRALLLERRVRLAYADVLEAELREREPELLAQIEQLRGWALDLEQTVLRKDAELEELRERVLRLESELTYGMSGRLRTLRELLRRRAT